MSLLAKSAGTGTAGISVRFNNTGTVNVSSGTLSFQGDFTQTAGVTRLNGGALSTTTGLDFEGGILTGFGTITGNVSTATGAGAGQVDPGLSPGILNITGNYTQGTTGTIDIELGGLTAGTEYDQLNITGSATLAGTLNVTLLGGFSPSQGNSFTVMTFASRTGTFATTTLAPLGGGLLWNIVYSGTNVVLNVVLPSTDLSVAKTDAPDPVAVGVNLTYSMTVTNNGPVGATNVILTDTLPAGVTFVSASSSQGTWTQAGGTVTWNLGTIASGASATLTIAVRPTTAGIITNTASVTASVADSNSANNLTSASTMVSQPAPTPAPPPPRRPPQCRPSRFLYPLPRAIARTR